MSEEDKQRLYTYITYKHNLFSLYKNEKRIDLQ